MSSSINFKPKMPEGGKRPADHKPITGPSLPFNVDDMTLKQIAGDLGAINVTPLRIALALSAILTFEQLGALIDALYGEHKKRRNQHGGTPDLSEWGDEKP